MNYLLLVIIMGDLAEGIILRLLRMGTDGMSLMIVLFVWLVRMRSKGQGLTCYSIGERILLQ